ncbi:MAG: glycoside hydrolase family 30 protein [Spirochaetales bacterium]|nr:glycoside hydrolase family 30 protein [Spirochaetales bacterium]
MNKAIVIQTAKDTGDLLSQKQDIYFKKESEKSTSGAGITCNPDFQYQKIIGFGGAFTEAGASVLLKLNKEKQTRILESYFHPHKGIAYSLCRTHINSCDFSLGNYSSADVPGDTELTDFNIERDKGYLIPFIKSAFATQKAQFRIVASAWSPPAWMKTNNQMNNGGKLKPEYRETWALFFSKYIKAYQREGIPIWGVTVQNEPDATQVWDSCRYTAEEERDFVRDYLGPCLEENGLKHIKIIIWDHNRDLLYERVKTVLSDNKASGYIWGVGFHWYSGDQFENVLKTHEAYPDKTLLLTEACIEDGVKLGAWDRGETYAYNIINDLNNGAGGWIDWNMVLNTAGGPNHAGNYCDAPVLVDEENGEIHYQSSYYYMGHFSKYVRPGAARIAADSTLDELETTAFKNPDGSIALVVLNRSDLIFPFQLYLGDKSVDLKIPQHAIITILISNTD